jgi:hypothetical protein
MLWFGPMFLVACTVLVCGCQTPTSKVVCNSGSSYVAPGSVYIGPVGPTASFSAPMGNGKHFHRDPDTVFSYRGCSTS